MTRRASLDTHPHPVFGSYSAGNFAEVAPPRLSIMSWSLLGDPVERAVRDFTRRMWPAASWQTGSHYVFVGYFNCRPYHNLAAFCHMARELPGLTAQDVTSSYFEDAPAPVLPRGLRGSSLARARAVPRMVRELVSLRPRLAEIEGRVVELEEGVRDALSAGSAPALGACLACAAETLDRVWALHYSTTLALVPLRALHGALGRRVLTHWPEIEPWLGRPGELVWGVLADMRTTGLPGRPAEFLDRGFYEVADDLEPWRDYALQRTVGGHAQEPSRAWLDPGVAIWDIEPLAKATLLPQLNRVLSDTMTRREDSKSLAMRCMHVFRGLIPPLAREAGLAERMWPYLTLSEIADAHRHDDLNARAERRCLLCAEALERDAPEELLFNELKPRRGALRHAPRRARGISPGQVTGMVVDRASAAMECGAPKVLVCESADADVQPILPLVDGVLTTHGSALSHVAILVREYGIPAVVGHPLTCELLPGQWVAIDGTKGEVRIVEH
jgi:phosphohistidine swiveling domain-containing protein